jgi:hypothetical protein
MFSRTYLPKEHEAQYLALCPLCAAMYEELVKSDDDAMADETGLKAYWEHLGMMDIPEYRERWENKLTWYIDQGIKLYEECGGPNGTLITTMDDERGGIQSDEIEMILNKVIFS